MIAVKVKALRKLLEGMPENADVLVAHDLYGLVALNQEAYLRLVFLDEDGRYHESPEGDRRAVILR